MFLKYILIGAIKKDVAIEDWGGQGKGAGTGATKGTAGTEFIYDSGMICAISIKRILVEMVLFGVNQWAYFILIHFILFNQCSMTTQITKATLCG